MKSHCIPCSLLCLKPKRRPKA